MDGPNGSILNADPVGGRTNFTQEDNIIDTKTFESNVEAARTSAITNLKHLPYFGPDSVSRVEEWGLDKPTVQISYVIGL